MDWKALRERGKSAWKALPGRVTPRAVLRWSAIGVAVVLFGVTTEAFFRARLVSPERRLPTALYTRPTSWRGDGEPEAPVPIGSVSGGPVDERIPLSLHQIPDQLVQAVLAVEDRRFYQHHGLDFRRIAGAFVANVRAGGIVQGGSTITQQLAKNLFLSADRTPIRKLREAAMALMLESRYSKAEILQAYLNEIYLGQDGARPIRGVGAAAHYYFGRDVRRISLAQAAQLAAMISAPNRYDADRHPSAARERRNMVLGLMADQHRISADAAHRAERTGVSTGTNPAPSVDGRYFRDFVASALGHLPRRGVSVYTTLDAGLQRAAESAVSRALRREGLDGAEAAVVVLDPRTGDILAMVGGTDYTRSQFNRAANAERQPGSAFKPIVALAALQRQHDDMPEFTLASVLDDEPLSVQTPGGVWQPMDYDQEFRGPVTFREAMEQSLNIPFARIGLAVGPDKVAAMGRQLGISSPLRPVPSIALGSSEVTLLELARAYGVLADEGGLAATRSILGISHNGDSVVSVPVPEVHQVVDSAVTYLVTSTLEGVVTRGTGRALDQDESLGGVAGKTGTSNDWRDAWFVAYSPSLVIGAWVGYDDGRSLHVPGATAALPIVASLFDAVTPEDGWPAFDVPDGITEGYVTDPGSEAGFGCGQQEVFLSGTVPPGSDCSQLELHAPDWRFVTRWGSSLEQSTERAVRRWVERELERLRSHH